MQVLLHAANSDYHPLREIGNSRFPQIFRYIKPFASLDYNFAAQVLKKEKIAITLLFFSALGLFPAWFAATCAICGIARLAWTLYQNALKVEEMQKMSEQAGKLSLENRDLKQRYEEGVKEREEIQNERDALRHQVEELTRNKDALEQELDDMMGEMAAMTHQHIAEIRDLELEVQARDANAQIDQAVIQERDLLKAVVQFHEQATIQNLAERNQALQGQGEAIQEKEKLLKELEQMRAKEQASPLLKEWTEIEQKRNEQLAQIRQAYNQAMATRQEEQIVALEMIAEQVLPGLQAQKQQTIHFLEEAMHELPVHHASRTALAAVKEIYSKEAQNLSSVAKVFALPATLRRLLQTEVR